MACWMGEDIRMLVNTDSGIVLVCEILAGIPADILAGLGKSVAVLHDVVRHLTVGDDRWCHSQSSCEPNATNNGLR